jgi:CRP/FNR family cyclic AMP-dependent transcriptional regulator
MQPTPLPRSFTPVIAHVQRRPASPLAPDAAALERFLGYCHRRRYPARTDVFRPGDPAGTLYYVVSGSTSIITEEDDDREHVLG